MSHNKKENALFPALVVGASALAAPWLLYIAISRLLNSAVERELRERDESKHVDFV